LFLERPDEGGSSRLSALCEGCKQDFLEGKQDLMEFMARAYVSSRTRGFEFRGFMVRVGQSFQRRLLSRIHYLEERSRMRRERLVEDARSLLYREEFDRVLDITLNLLQTDPSDIEAWSLRGQALSEMLFARRTGRDLGGVVRAR